MLGKQVVAQDIPQQNAQKPRLLTIEPDHRRCWDITVVNPHTNRVHIM